MGSYGFGPARTAAAAVEQYADEEGISWPRTIAPFDVELVTLGKPGSEERDVLRRACTATSRPPASTSSTTSATPGPGRSSPTPSCWAARCGSPSGGARSAPGEIEVQVRRGRESRTVPVEGAAEAVAELWRGLP